MNAASSRSFWRIGATLVALALASVVAAVLSAAGSPGVRLGLVAVPLALMVVALVRGLRQLDRMLAAQRAESLRFHTALDNISQGVCFFDGHQRLIVCNRRYAEMYHLTLDQVRPGTTLTEIVDLRFQAGTCPAMSPDAYLAWRSSITVSDKPSDSVATLSDGRVFSIHHRPMPDGGWVATHEDITDRRRALVQIERMARSDALTGLANRVEFREHFDSMLKQASADDPVALMFIDLDRFKAVNDTLGHLVGDHVLKAAAARLGECVRHSDLVARLGGDEFAIVQFGAQPIAARALAERLVSDLDRPFEIDGQQVQVGVSVGVALAPEHGSDPDDLLMKADLALYQAKAAGRGTHRFFNASMLNTVRNRREELAHPLRGA